jgi:hypothetical protein
MKCLIFLLVLSCGLALPSALMAQSSDHVEVGVFADYMNFGATDPHINFVGVCGRAAFNVHPNVQLEAEMSYDFKRNFTSVFSNGVTTQFVNTNLRPLTALFGPKFQTSSGPFRAYVTGKLGFVNFSVSDQNAPAGFVGAVGAFRPETPVSPCILAPESRDSGVRSACVLKRATRFTLITAHIITSK